MPFSNSFGFSLVQNRKFNELLADKAFGFGEIAMIIFER